MAWSKEVHSIQIGCGGTVNIEYVLVQVPSADTTVGAPSDLTLLGNQLHDCCYKFSRCSLSITQTTRIYRGQQIDEVYTHAAQLGFPIKIDIQEAIFQPRRDSPLNSEHGEMIYPYTFLTLSFRAYKTWCPCLFDRLSHSSGRGYFCPLHR